MSDNILILLSDLMNIWLGAIFFFFCLEFIFLHNFEASLWYSASKTAPNNSHLLVAMPRMVPSHI